jgi:alanine racemase
VARSTTAYINLSAIEENLRLLTELAGDSKVIAVVKADAYGNGAVEVAKRIEHKVSLLAVAILEEAIELRAAGITKAILILQGAHDAADFAIGQTHNVIWLLHSEWQLDAYSAFLHASKHSASAWFKFDTGMHRLGLDIEYFPQLLADYPHLIKPDTVIVTHLACADEPDHAHAQAQIKRFKSMVAAHNMPLCIANSATNIRFQEARQDYVRLGIALYGSSPFQASDDPITLRPVMSLNTSIMALRTIPKGDTVGYGGTWRAPKTSIIATVALGYADGYPRHAPTGTPAMCQGQVIPLVGRVSMDMLTFDVSALDSPSVGDIVQLWGDLLPINQVADHIGTIGYELMTRVSKRVPRVYTND